MAKQCRQGKWNKKLDNSGSTFIVVMVGISFLTVLSTIIIAVSVANIQMKYQEHITKKNFYEEEKILDDIYHGIGQVAGEYLAQAYSEVLGKIPGSGDGSENIAYKSQEAAFNAFSQKFVEKLVNEFGGCHAVPEELEAARGKLQGYVTVPDRALAVNPGADATIVVEGIGAIEIIDINNAPPQAGGSTAYVPYQYQFRDVAVMYRETSDNGAETGYESTITTDIVIEVPYVNFFQDTSRILEYAMVANKGIYFKDTGAAPAIRKVIGNVYAGINSTDTPQNLETYRGLKLTGDEVGVYGGLNFAHAQVDFFSHYLVTKGDINILDSVITTGPDSDDPLSSSRQPQIWAESIRTVGQENRLIPVAGTSNVRLSGDIYVANDMELNEDNCTVTLTGSYYGYNEGAYEPELKTWEEKKYASSLPSSPEHTQNSSIIINGNNTTLDFSGVQELIINGLAYVDFNTRPTKPDGGLIEPRGTIEEYATGEALALKSNQHLYMVPSELLSTTNPVVSSAAPADHEVWKGNIWFGITHGFVHDGTNPTGSYPFVAKDIVDRNTGGVYRYYFLNFISPEMRTKYVGLILNMPNPDDIAAMGSGSQEQQDLLNYYDYNLYDSDEQAEIWEIKQNLQDRASAVRVNSGSIGDASRFFVQGAVVKSVPKVSGETGYELSYEYPDPASLSDGGKWLDRLYARKLESELFYRYISLYQNLTPSEGLSSTGSAGSLSGEIDKDTGAYENLNVPSTNTGNYDVDPNRLPVDRYVSLQRLDDYNPRGSESNYTRYEADSSYRTIINDEDVEIKDGDFTGIILCSGDVYIRSGRSVTGLVVAGGRIYVEGGGSIQSDRGVVQAILDEEMREESKTTNSQGNIQYAVTYFREIQVNRMGTDNSRRISSTNYTQYIGFDNWRKG